MIMKRTSGEVLKALTDKEASAKQYSSVVEVAVVLLSVYLCTREELMCWWWVGAHRVAREFSNPTAPGSKLFPSQLADMQQNNSRKMYDTNFYRYREVKDSLLSSLFVGQESTHNLRAWFCKTFRT